MERLRTDKVSSDKQTDLLDRAQRIWTMLDELSEQNPDGYKRFIDQQMKEGREMMKPPAPAVCMRSEMVDTATPLYVNICSYEGMTKPKPGTKTSILFTDFLEFEHEGCPAMCVAVAYHPEIVAEIKNDPLQALSYGQSAVQFLQTAQQTTLSLKLTHISDSFVGPRSLLYELPRKLHGLPINRKRTEQEQSPPQATVFSLGNIVAKEARGEDDAPLLSNNSECGAQPKLVEEISSSAKEQAAASPKTFPERSYSHSTEFRPAQDGRPARFVVTVKLPEGTRLDQLCLDVSETDIQLSVHGQSPLLVAFQARVDAAKARATLNKAAVLTVKCPLY